ncbi:MULTISPECIES: hypothetical protein [Aliiruegeria]|uniref:Uncharacterized protein n=1 Tax=Aliiruegeria lutimaris TaxID=571298 RepID=A0A1G8JUX1_9RHOB|nr:MULTISPECIES: hypothetical protein [Aliiruegeria]SDI34883.1 hypothetical protein SAMN04488026_100267 [Aliiruegeria lutimaris]
MMKRHSLGSAPDYTTAALVTLGINLFCLLCAIWALFGFAAVLLFGFAADRALNFLQRRRR